jgi:uncharacterized protein YraI
MTNLPRKIVPLALAAGLAFVASAASAAPGIALANANVRSGPGTTYSVVDTLKTGDYVVVVKCSAAWCQIERVGPDGWVFRPLLRNPYYHPRGIYDFPPKDLIEKGRIPVGR